MAFKRVIDIGGIKLGKNKKPFIVAELSGNHNQSLSRALRLVDLAADSGANAIKLQTYTPETLTLKSNKNEFKIKDKKSLWYNQNLFKLYQKAYTPWDWHKVIFDHAKKKGLVFFGHWIPPYLTGYSFHIYLTINDNDHCGSLRECEECVAFFKNLSPDYVRYLLDKNI